MGGSLALTAELPGLVCVEVALYIVVYGGEYHRSITPTQLPPSAQPPLVELLSLQPDPPVGTFGIQRVLPVRLFAYRLYHLVKEITCYPNCPVGPFAFGPDCLAGITFSDRAIQSDHLPSDQNVLLGVLCSVQPMHYALVRHGQMPSLSQQQVPLSTLKFGTLPIKCDHPQLR